MHINSKNLIWIDLEMTGLDSQNDKIIEAAIIITDSDLNTITEGPVIAIHQDNEILTNMDNWNKKHHGQSGLIERVQHSTINEKTAETIIDFLQQYVPPSKSPMCGNSICQDRRFLAQNMPLLEKYFHYRNLDVSSVKILAQRWAPHIANGYTKISTHVALQDIRDSIEELQYYRQNLFKCDPIIDKSNDVE